MPHHDRSTGAGVIYLEVMMGKHRYHFISSTLLAVAIALSVGSVAAQSDDPDRPTLMTTNEAKGRWPAGAGVAYYFGFEAGPGEIIVMFDFKVDDVVQNVSAQVTDSYGRGLKNLDDKEGRSVFSWHTTSRGIRFVGRYQLNKRQKLVAKIAIEGEENIPGTYKVRVDGESISFGQPADPTNQSDPAIVIWGTKTEKKP